MTNHRPGSQETTPQGCQNDSEQGNRGCKVNLILRKTDINQTVGLIEQMSHMSKYTFYEVLHGLYSVCVS